ncbi:MAG: hypothetical protein GVY13_14725 [Alphaproteobacteria bacterium]|jgi:hypothetical protein|nr:hypothetical protein [Alphaproteobacteria bacterium]
MTRLLVLMLLLVPLERVAADDPWPGDAVAAGPLSLTDGETEIRLHGLDLPGGWVWLDRSCPDGKGILNTLLEHRTITCRTVARIDAATVEAVCAADGLDLAVPLLLWGHVTTAADASRRYRGLEGVGGAYGRGLWGEDRIRHWE